MSAMFGGALGVSAVSCIEFIVFLVIGLAAGWLFAGPHRWSSHFSSLAVVSVCGAWMGAEFAHLFGRADWDGAGGLAAAMLGSVGLAYAWRRLHPPPLKAGEIIVIHHPHA